jgi:hypothetical protein
MTGKAAPLLLLTIVAASQVVAYSQTDRAALASLRQAVAGLENGVIGPRQFERQAPRSNIPTWQRLQRRIPSTQSGSADLALALAYYGVEYRQNLGRLLAPYRRWTQTHQKQQGPISRHDASVVQSLPTDLGILYRKHRDAQSLGLLLDLRLDADEQAEGQRQEVLRHLWPENEVAILRAASGSRERLQSVAEMLDANYASTAGARATHAELQRLTHHPDRRVAKAATELLHTFGL